MVNADAPEMNSVIRVRMSETPFGSSGPSVVCRVSSMLRTAAGSASLFGVVSCARTDVCSPTIEISTGSRNLFITTPDLLVVEASAIHQSRVEDALDEVSVNASSSIGGAASTVNEKNVASISAMPKVRVPADKPTAIQANVKMASD